MNSKNTKYKANMNKIIDDMKPFVGRSNFLCSDDEIGESNAVRLEECQLIKEVLIENGFENAGLSDAMGLWGQYSESYAAGWMGLPDEKKEIFECIKGYIVICFHYSSFDQK